jgi:23S rRNA pseudouridine1911/1915/1917 synthase
MKKNMDRDQVLLAGAEDCDLRLDQFLARHLPTHSRSQISRWVRAGEVTVQGKPARTSHRVQEGDEVRVTLPEPIPSELVPEPHDLNVLHEDDQLLVLNKDAGMVVHPGAGVASGTLVHALLARGERWSTIGGVHRPGIVHRLDRTTSGVMVVARTDAAHRHLSQQFSDRTVTKRYRAVVHGCPQAARGLIEAPIGRHRTHRSRMAVRNEGRPARTRYQVEETFPLFSYLRLQLLTGRTHQIRVHLSELGHPLLGDRLYGAPEVDPSTPMGSAAAAFSGVALHAEIITFQHPETGEELTFTASMPELFQALLTALRRATP